MNWLAVSTLQIIQLSANSELFLQSSPNKAKHLDFSPTRRKTRTKGTKFGKIEPCLKDQALPRGCQLLIAGRLSRRTNKF